VLAASLGTLILAAGAWLGIARIESHSRSSVVERMLGMVRSDQQELDTLLREVRDLRAVPDAGPETESRLAKLRARVAAKQTELRGKVGAIVGLTLPTPDPRALELARTESFRLIELLVELGDHAAASVFIESILEQYDDHNVLRFSDEEIRRLRELAAEVESQGRRRSRRQSGHLGVGSESRYRVN
jgi:hypothetical protein